MSEDPENLVLPLLRDMRGEIKEMRAEMATKSDIADVRSEIHSLRADVASDLLTLEKRLSDQILGVRRAVMEYHSTAVGHGILFTEIEERVRRIEKHLGLAPSKSH